MTYKIIHYCWFGRNPLPKSSIKCIESWKKFLPDYEIKEWNEDNFDVNMTPYTQEAYEAKKYAFVSDYARFWILYKYGGLYFDTDVEIIRPMYDIIERGPFLGAEIDGNAKTKTTPKVAPGLCIGAVPNMRLYKEILSRYETMHLFNEDGVFNTYTMIPLVTDLLIADGMLANNDIQQVSDITIYPAEYFNPLDVVTGRLNVTENTRSIHWFMATWLPNQSPILKKIKQYIRRFLKLFK